LIRLFKKYFFSPLTETLKKLRFSHLYLSLNYFLRKSVISDNRNFKKINKALIKREKGFAKINFNNNNNLKKLIVYTKKKFPPKVIISESKNKSKESFLKIHKIDVLEHKDILNFLKDKDFQEIISSYLRSTPILTHASVWYSKNKTSQPQSSQLFHFDREDRYQLKVFIPILPILEDSGPLTLLSSKQSSDFIRSSLLKFRLVSLKDRIEDSTVIERLGTLKPFKMTADQGEIIFADTTNCLHYGSRNSLRPKYHLTIQFLSVYSYKLQKFMKQFKQNKNSVIDSFSYLRWQNKNLIN
tara:strand:- start:418 stop:1314 length:897 start_codon:yes stop_codon:yes gene_type:complete